MLGGYMGRILEIDLSVPIIRTESLQESLLRGHIGGSGLGARILYDRTGPGTDPIGPDNLLILMTGPLTGTRVPTSGRHAVVTRSPLTGIFAESDIGGTWGATLKRAGYDGVIIRGRADKPVYLWISDEGVRLKDASHLWGMDIYRLDGHLKEETSPDAVVLCIGPAGEKMVRIASIMSDGADGRAAGRCGVGAVMGSKNLKAVVVSGRREVPVAYGDVLGDSIRRVAPSIVQGTRERGLYGTAAWMLTAEHTGDLPVQNWRKGKWEEGAERLSGQTMARRILKKRYYCSSCIVGCGREVHVAEGPYSGVAGAGPEYETLGMLGACCMVDDLEAIAMAHQLCNQYGIDVISAGGAIAFAMECYEHGLITHEDAGGVELTWGNPSAMIEMVRQIGSEGHEQHRRHLCHFEPGGVPPPGVGLPGRTEAEDAGIRVPGAARPFLQ